MGRPSHQSTCTFDLGGREVSHVRIGGQAVRIATGQLMV